MRVRPFIMLIAAGTATAILSTACGEGDPGGLDPPTTMFTTIDGVVRSADSAWVDSIPVPGVVVRAWQAFHPNPPRDDGQVLQGRVARATTGPNGEYHIEFTASCLRGFGYYLTIDAPYYWRPTGYSGNPGSLRGVCTVPNIRFDIWVLHD